MIAANPREMFSLASRSGPSVSVSYGTADAGLYYRNGEAVNYASSGRAAELVAQMPSSHRKTLLEPIERGLIDPQSVFYLIDDESEEGQVAISVEDFVHLASTCLSQENNAEQQNENGYASAEGDTPIPHRLADELLRISEPKDNPTFGYTSIDNENGDTLPSDQSRLRGESSASEASTSSNDPILPESRPPALPYFPPVGSLDIQQYAELDNAGVFGNFYQPMDRSMRTISAPEPKSNLSILGAVYSTPIYSKIMPLTSSDDNTKTNKGKYWTKINSIAKRRFLFSLLIAVVVAIIAIVLAIGIYFLLKNTHSKKPLITTTHSTPRRNETYDCVNGSMAGVFLDNVRYTLAELNLPEQYPTLTAGSLEYLVVPNITNWWYAQKYCTAWCGYVVSIKGAEETAMILGMVRQSLPKFSNYWIGVKSWNNKWYLDDEANMTYYNFANADQQDATNLDNFSLGCVYANGSGSWFSFNCHASYPFVCERNTADPNIQRAPFAPHQEEKCQEAGGKCKLDNDCADGHQKAHLCPDQANNVLCCVPKKPTPAPLFNSSMINCADAGGICNHVDVGECPDGIVLYHLDQPCLGGPRRYDCCVKNENFF